ncbi:uncharacterized protein LOC129969132 [Argiope bruennichi]|uniref:uncharacterized protein LOC129969132 n=1 Tax=Argiope bruennichi TaxID=94029 RepID=UPI002494DB5D|nr:uncharacterized protein LOC129969132 [Argiope bruennichi]XP_055939529.1 uncharacterized protein LOC129969132 [Argiope bruennichi]XP_055939530.1 uncharacterized protein LOC129969132 [Argiope bruennichi]
MDMRYAVLIYHLPEAYLNDAVKSVIELTTISENSVSLMKSDHWGAKLVLENEHSFLEVISLCALSIRNKTYPLYSLVTDLIVCGAGVRIDALKVKFLLERYAPVLMVYEMKNQDGVITFRATLNYPEIPEIVKLWTGSNMKISGYDGTEITISSFCRFCRQNGHLKSQCCKRKIPVFKRVISSSPPLQNYKVADKRTAVSSSDNNELTNFAPRNSEGNAGSSDSNEVSGGVTKSKRNKKIPFRTASLKPRSPPINLIHLIPPTMKNDIKKLRLFFSDCKNFKNLYKKALRYPEGIGPLLKLRKILKFNKDVINKSEEEMEFICWICLLLAKIQYLHLKRNVPLEPEPYLLNTEDVKSENSAE